METKKEIRNVGFLALGSIGLAISIIFIINTFVLHVGFLK